MILRVLYSLFLVLIIGTASISGCLGSVEPKVDSSTVRILTYDVYALSEEMIEQFEKESGYEVLFTKVGDG